MFKVMRWILSIVYSGYQPITKKIRTFVITPKQIETTFIDSNKLIN